MATVTETVKESLLGATVPEGLSSTSREVFLRHARQDAENGEHYMGEEEFVNAIAPSEENYVSTVISEVHTSSVRAFVGTSTDEPFLIAQDQA